MKKRLLFTCFLVLSITLTASVKPKKLFNLKEIPILVIYVKGYNWQTLLSNFDRNSKASDKVPVEKIIFYDTENGKVEKIKDLGGGRLSIKGNMSRIRPELGGHNTSYGNFKQANFKVKMDENDLFGYNSLDLKFFKADKTKAREILVLDMLRKALKNLPLEKDSEYSVIPYGSFVHLYIAIDDKKHDHDKTGNKFNPLDHSMQADDGYFAYDYGLYGILEDVSSKAFLKTRFGSSKDKNGYFWKCGYQTQPANFYMKVNDDNMSERFTYGWYKEKLRKTSPNNTDSHQPFGIKSTKGRGAYKPCFNFTGKDENLRNATKLLCGYIYNLNKLKGEDLVNWIKKGVVPEGYENPFSEEANSFKTDYKSFLTIMAVQQLLACWDSYWHNSNNYAVYFDKKDKTFYFIPYDLKLSFGNRKEGESTHALGRHDLYNVTYNGKPIEQQGLVYNMLNIPEFRNYYSHQLLEICKNILEPAVNRNYSETIGTWYQLMCKNFDQTHDEMNRGKKVDERDVMTPDSTNPEDYAWIVGKKKFLRLPNDITSIHDGENDKFVTVRVEDWPVSWSPQHYRVYSSNRTYNNEMATDAVGYNFGKTAIDNAQQRVNFVEMKKAQ